MTVGRHGRLSDAPASLHVVGARVIDPTAARDAVGDVVIRDGRIAEDGAGLETMDGAGLVVAPGFCDLHTHLREPGDGAAETLSSGTRAAARGGFTTVSAMPNTDPPLDDPAVVAAVHEAARDVAVRVRVVAAVSRGRAGRELADLDALAAAGIAAASDDGAAVRDDLLPRALRELARHRLILIEHAEDPTLAASGVMRAGPTATRLGLEGWAAEAEVAVVRRDIAAAEETGARIHLTHLSVAESVELVRAAKRRGAPITCDVTPHHMAMTDEWVAGSRRYAWETPSDQPALDERLAYDGACRVNPPLGRRHDALALLAGLGDGTVDAIATDHAPHPPERKMVPFTEAAPGLIGLETALSIGLAAVEAGMLSLATLVAALSTRPAAILGESRGFRIGGPADVVVFDPAARWRVEESALASLSANTPLLGMELPGVVRLTVADGRVTYRS